VNTSPDQLDQLFRAARLASSSQPDVVPPFGLETRVLAAWRSSRGATLWDTGVLVRGLAVAILLVLASSWPAFEKQTNSDSENLQFADSSVQSDFSQ
jgi:hypothetical protein